MNPTKLLTKIKENIRHTKQEYEEKVPAEERTSNIGDMDELTSVQVGSRKNFLKISYKSFSLDSLASLNRFTFPLRRPQVSFNLYYRQRKEVDVANSGHFHHFCVHMKQIKRPINLSLS